MIVQIHRLTLIVETSCMTFIIYAHPQTYAPCGLNVEVRSN